MKKLLLSFFAVAFLGVLAQAQCNELFISEYVEGYANNKALEIYNPTQSSINLGEYALARFSNGATSAPASTPSYVVQLPNEMLASGETYVVVVDLTEVTEATVYSQFDKPVWNGYMVVDTIFDQVTGEPILDMNGDIVMGVQYDNGVALFDYNETTYYPEYDLQGKANVFLCPDYDVNRTMYFNGNDAMALIKGTEVSTTGDNLIDVIGVIGENPETTIEQDAWVDADGSWLTKDNTMIRNADVTQGRIDPNEIVFAAGGTFVGDGWTSYWKNDFSKLGWHECNCLSSSTTDLNTIDFNAYPNPVSESQITVESKENIFTVEISNAMGQIVQSTAHNGTQIQEDVSALAKGMYFLTVHFKDNQKSVRKIIIE